MKIRINISNCMLVYIILIGMFYGYLEHEIFWRIGILLFVLLAIFNMKILKKSHYKVIICLILIVALIILNYINGGDVTYLANNLRMLLYPILLGMIFLHLNVNSVDVIRNVLFSKKFYMFINLFWILNLLIIAIQVSGKPMFIKSVWLNMNSFYLDQCCGLFGFSATHQLAFFSVFILIYNLVMADLKEKRKILIRVYVTITQIIMFILSTANDNMAIYIFTPIFLAFYLFSRSQWKSARFLNKIIKSIKYFIVIACFFLGLYNISSIKSFINESVIKRIYNVINAIYIYDSSSVNGSNERIAIVQNALNNSWGWKFGRGLGAWGLELAGFDGYRHFGISSIGAIITLGGIALYLVICIYMAIICEKIIYKKGRSFICFFISLVIIMMISIYTNNFTSIVTTIWILFTFQVLGELRSIIIYNN